MAAKGGINQGLKTVNNAINTVGSFAGVATAAIAVAGEAINLAKPAIDAAIENHNKKLEELKNHIEMPDLFPTNYITKLDKAIEWLEKAGLEYDIIVVQPNIKFKDCVNQQLIETNYKAKDLIPPGKSILLKYITDEVITESKNIFDALEKNKLDSKQVRDEKVKQTIDSAAGVFKKGFGSITGIISKRKEASAPNSNDKLTVDTIEIEKENIT